MRIRFFGEIGPKITQYSKVVYLQDRDIVLDLNTENVLGSYRWVPDYDNYVSKIGIFRREIEIEIHNDFQNKGTTYEWIKYHIDELQFTNEEVDDMVDIKYKYSSLSKKLLSLLNVVRIDICPGEEEFAVWIFGLDDELSDEMLLVATDINGSVIDFGWETEGE